MREQSAVRTDIALLTRRLAAGDEDAFRQFHAQYFDRLYHFLLVVARGNEDEARDALQEALVRVARRARRFDDHEAFWCWLKVVARNAARDAGRKQQRYRALLQQFSVRVTDGATGAVREEDHLRVLLKETLAGLSDNDRQLIEEKYLDGATIRELAEAAGQTEKTVESRLARLRRELRERLLKRLNEP